ncbi:flagellar basal body rod protein FlgC [Rhodovulum sp. BSW8]|uniref:Flagellar basal body rod protein FlgB n=3 Tax=Rhodovulum TaxID=34008 RepID=A0ABS1REZ2_9RHOB|nr:MULTISPECIES: flagellar basal body rod protein FlgC [Rhodovulum]OLS43642.1 flagellar basal body rod protein FlgC [Rhodovulum sulfidophilum]MBL3568964.1 flagellar basal body rod protein FlgC [Rhodovulum visakhapatnamense]MBL3578105.1 flagellar basal body rod protein FlgC [Rhodovulum visakhapatnamense]PTW47666.1 flagellar basal-body rod protein FlgC [Rhodovulum kholense]RAP41632.1 flagellar basal body rod protein FlgC [Rhodovulum viride]
MNDLSQSFGLSASGLKAQATRLRLVSENIANADTPGYRRKLTTFETQLTSDGPTGEVQTGRVTLDQSDLSMIHDPSHPLADAEGNYSGSNVDLVVEIADAREAQRSYEANLKMFDQARQMSRGLLDLLRR